MEPGQELGLWRRRDSRRARGGEIVHVGPPHTGNRAAAPSPELMCGHHPTGRAASGPSPPPISGTLKQLHTCRLKHLKLSHFGLTRPPSRPPAPCKRGDAQGPSGGREGGCPPRHLAALNWPEKPSPSRARGSVGQAPSHPQPWRTQVSHHRRPCKPKGDAAQGGRSVISRQPEGGRRGVQGGPPAEA